MPGPTDGNWSTSPTSSRLACGGSARSRWFISSTSTIEVSSTTSRSQSSGRPSLRVKPPEAGSDFQQAVDGLGLEAGRLREPLGGAARGSAQQAPHLLGPQDQQDGVDERRLAHARPAGDDQHPAGQRLPERVPLAGRQLLAGLLPGTRRRPSRSQWADSSAARRTGT